jgi:hypothetical protein
MLIVDMSAVKLPVEAEQNNLPPKGGQPIDMGGEDVDYNAPMCRLEERVKMLV